jgi:hypothetical protein
MYILSSQSQLIQSKIYRAVLDEVAKSSNEIRLLLRSAKRNVALRPKLVQIVNDILRARLECEQNNHIFTKVIRRRK